MIAVQFFSCFFLACFVHADTQNFTAVVQQSIEDNVDLEFSLQWILNQSKKMAVTTTPVAATTPKLGFRDFLSFPGPSTPLPTPASSSNISQLKNDYANHLLMWQGRMNSNRNLTNMLTLQPQTRLLPLTLGGTQPAPSTPNCGQQACILLQKHAQNAVFLMPTDADYPLMAPSAQCPYYVVAGACHNASQIVQQYQLDGCRFYKTLKHLNSVVDRVNANRSSGGTVMPLTIKAVLPGRFYTGYGSDYARRKQSGYGEFLCGQQGSSGNSAIYDSCDNIRSACQGSTTTTTTTTTTSTTTMRTTTTSSAYDEWFQNANDWWNYLPMTRGSSTQAPRPQPSRNGRSATVPQGRRKDAVDYEDYEWRSFSSNQQQQDQNRIFPLSQGAPMPQGTTMAPVQVQQPSDLAESYSCEAPENVVPSTGPTAPVMAGRLSLTIDGKSDPSDTLASVTNYYSVMTSKLKAIVKKLANSASTTSDYDDSSNSAMTTVGSAVGLVLKTARMYRPTMNVNVNSSMAAGAKRRRRRGTRKDDSNNCPSSVQSTALNSLTLNYEGEIFLPWFVLEDIVYENPNPDPSASPLSTILYLSQGQKAPYYGAGGICVQQGTLLGLNGAANTFYNENAQPFYVTAIVGSPHFLNSSLSNHEEGVSVDLACGSGVYEDSISCNTISGSCFNGRFAQAIDVVQYGCSQASWNVPGVHCAQYS